MVEKTDLLQWPQKIKDTPTKKYSKRYCRFHRDKRHGTEDCYKLKNEIERLVGYFKEFILKKTRAAEREGTHERKERGRSWSKERFKGRVDNAPVKGVIHTIAGGPAGGDSGRSRKKYARYLETARRSYRIMSVDKEEDITFGKGDLEADMGSQNDPMVIKMDIANFLVHKVLVDNGSWVDILFINVLRKMEIEVASLQPLSTPLVGFGDSEVIPLGTIDLPVSIGAEPKRKTMMVKFLGVDTHFVYNVILGRPGLNLFRAVLSTFHLKM
ncbi:UNVERIFIED_CONTAM: hypothetical protein Sradi_7014800 [Sesamum radiatum]|uniref:Reverse transcriptase domain-containing protein n=1 Tax=Sesamum radiatum TaxID=300843 RepID=A0AAW2JBM0_SESRA